MIEEFTDQLAKELMENTGFLEILKDAILNKVAFDDSPWDGSDSRWDTPEAYCSDCLIDLNESGAQKTKDKCKLPYRSPGSKKINKGALRAMAGGHGIPALKGVPASAKQKAARWVVSKWRAAFGKEAPENLQQIASGGGGKSRSMFVKDLEGNTWFFGVYSNRFEDREFEILSEKSHEEYRNWVLKTGFEPPVTIFHQPRVGGSFWMKVFNRYGDDGEKLNEIVDKVFDGFSFARVKRIMYVGGFVVVAAKVLPDMLDVADRLSQEKDLGMSHGFINLDMEGRVFNAYRSFEMSVLPGKRAANAFTLGSFIKDLVMDDKNLGPEDRAWIESVYGEEKAPALIAAMEDFSEVGKRLEGVLDFKDVEEIDNMDKEEKELTQEEEEVPADRKQSEEEPVTGEEKQDTTEEEEEEDTEEETMKVAAKVVELINPQQLLEVLTDLTKQVKALSEKVAELESLPERVKQIEKSDDEKLSAQWLPMNWANVHNPSQAKDNVLTEDEKEAVKKLGGPSMPQSKEAKSDNVLEIGFWRPLGVK